MGQNKFIKRAQRLRMKKGGDEARRSEGEGEWGGKALCGWASWGFVCWVIRDATEVWFEPKWTHQLQHKLKICCVKCDKILDLHCIKVYIVTVFSVLTESTFADENSHIVDNMKEKDGFIIVQTSLTPKKDGLLFFFSFAFFFMSDTRLYHFKIWWL